MSVATARSQLCLKRLLDEPQDNLLKCKRVCLVPPPPSTGPSPCLRPTSPTSESSPSQSPFKVGPYFLFERYEKEEIYRAVHSQTQQQYTCQVRPTQETPLVLLILEIPRALLIVLPIMLTLQNIHHNHSNCYYVTLTILSLLCCHGYR